MQNIDFSGKIHAQSGALKGGGRPAFADTAASAPAKISGHWLWILLALSASYAAGIWSGLKIGEFSAIEKNLIKYPDTLKKESRDAHPQESYTGKSFSNIALEGDPGAGNYIIFIGSFEPETAALTANRLNNLPDLAAFRPMRCARIRESVPGRYPAFRTRSREDSLKQDVFVGCFPREDAAGEVLSVIVNSGIKGTSAARIYSIE